jgi:hypothetical protein
VQRRKGGPVRTAKGILWHKLRNSQTTTKKFSTDYALTSKCLRVLNTSEAKYNTTRFYKSMANLPTEWPKFICLQCLRVDCHTSVLVNIVCSYFIASEYNVRDCGVHNFISCFCVKSNPYSEVSEYTILVLSLSLMLCFSVLLYYY